MVLDFPWSDEVPNNSRLSVNQKQGSVLKETTLDFHAKLCIVITDGAPSGLFSDLVGPDPWERAHALKRSDIILTVLGIQPDVAICYDFYCALSQITGRCFY